MIEYVVITSFICFGIHASTRAGKLLGAFTYPIEMILIPRKLNWITKPLWNCIICMSSFWSIATIVVFPVGFPLVYFVSLPYPCIIPGEAYIETVYFWLDVPLFSSNAILFVFAVCGLNAVLSNILKSLRPRPNQTQMQ